MNLNITINPHSTARNERDWRTNPSSNRATSCHIVVDVNEIIV